MTHDDLEPLRAILHRALTRYLTVTPRGLVLVVVTRRVLVAEARILGFGGARTLYRDQKPDCRSLDAIPDTGAVEGLGLLSVTAPVSGVTARVDLVPAAPTSTRAPRKSAWTS